MNPEDQQFVNFQDYQNPNVGSSVHVDLGTPNQQLFGNPPYDATGTGMMQDPQGFPEQKDRECEALIFLIHPILFLFFFDVCLLFPHCRGYVLNKKKLVKFFI